MILLINRFSGQNDQYLIFDTSQTTCRESALSIDLAREKALVWKQDLRVVPLSAFIYLLCYLDRSNIGECIEQSSKIFIILFNN